MLFVELSVGVLAICITKFHKHDWKQNILSDQAQCKLFYDFFIHKNVFQQKNQIIWKNKKIKISKQSHDCHMDYLKCKFLVQMTVLKMLTFILNFSHAYTNDFDTIKTHISLQNFVDQKNIRQSVELCFDCFAY